MMMRCLAARDQSVVELRLTMSSYRCMLTSAASPHPIRCLKQLAADCAPPLALSIVATKTNIFLFPKDSLAARDQ
jgi:hypothetical protein